MATKTVVCPECGSPAAPGRYACSECGALLAAVAIAPRGRVSVAPTEGPEPITDDGRPNADPEPDRAPHAAEDARAADPPAPTTVGDLLLGDAPAPTSDAVPDDDLDEPAPGRSHAFDEDAPLAAAVSRMSPQPGVLHDVPDAAPPSAEPVAADGPSWPPAGDRGPIAAPEPRTPAGVYLPPSAVLPPLDASGGSVITIPPTTLSGGGGATWAGRGTNALAGALGSVGVTAATSRRAVAVGAGLAALGLVLPWVNTIPGSSPLANYLDRWGLAFPGGWLVFAVVLALGALAMSSGRAASWPVGLPAVAVATFLGGLVWPYLIAGSSRALGILVVVVGSLVLLVGGLLDRHPGRHDGGEATV